MTYGDIIKHFKEPKNIIDCRPCVRPYFHTNIPEGLIIWLDNGDCAIYIPKKDVNTMKN